MPLVTVRLDRVFDVVYSSQKNNGHMTNFSIECDGHRHFALVLPGRLTFRDGMTVTAFLERENDWSTLQGWRDHATNEVIYQSSLRALIPIPFAIVLVCGAVMEASEEPLLSLLMVLAAVALVAGTVHIQRERLRVVEQLKSQPESPPS